MESSAAVAHLPQSLFWEAFLLTTVVEIFCLSYCSLPVNFLSTAVQSGHCSLTFHFNKAFVASELLLSFVFGSLHVNSICCFHDNPWRSAVTGIPKSTTTLQSLWSQISLLWCLAWRINESLDLSALYYALFCFHTDSWTLMNSSIGLIKVSVMCKVHNVHNVLKKH